MGFNEELQAEVKERVLADDEVSTIALTARNLLEKETRERQKLMDEHYKRHNNLSMNVDRQISTRELHGAGLENMLFEAAKANSAEKEDRARETAEIRRCLQALGEQITTVASEVRMEHEAEKKRTGEVHNSLDKSVNDLR